MGDEAVQLHHGRTHDDEGKAEDGKHNLSKKDQWI